MAPLYASDSLNGNPGRISGQVIGEMVGGILLAISVLASLWLLVVQIHKRFSCCTRQHRSASDPPRTPATPPRRRGGVTYPTAFLPKFKPKRTSTVNGASVGAHGPFHLALPTSPPSPTLSSHSRSSSGFSSIGEHGETLPPPAPALLGGRVLPMASTRTI